MKKLKVLSLFSGIGAFEKGLSNKEIEYELVNYCEIDEHASKCYSAIHNEDEAKNLWDVTKVDAYEIQDFDLLTHGSPCQDVSINGSQLGADENSGTRSSLLWETVRIIKAKKPKYIVWENVKNAISVKHIHNVDEYIETLSRIGYKSSYKVLNSKNYNIPQNRERVFIISILDGNEFKFPEAIELRKTLEQMCCFRECDNITENFVRYYKNNLDNNIDFFEYFNSLKVGSTGVKNMGMYKYDQLNRVTIVDSGEKVLSPTLSCRGVQNYCIKFFYKGKIYKPSPKMCFKLMGFSEDDFEKIKDIGTDSQLWDRAGNSIVVDVAEAIFENLFNK